MYDVVYSEQSRIPKNVLAARKMLIKDYPKLYSKIVAFEDCRDIEMLDRIELYAILTRTRWKKVKKIIFEFINCKTPKEKIKHSGFYEKTPYIQPYKFYKARSAKMTRGR